MVETPAVSPSPAPTPEPRLDTNELVRQTHHLVSAEEGTSCPGEQRVKQPAAAHAPAAAAAACSCLPPAAPCARACKHAAQHSAQWHSMQLLRMAGDRSERRMGFGWCDQAAVGPCCSSLLCCPAVARTQPLCVPSKLQPLQVEGMEQLKEDARRLYRCGALGCGGWKENCAANRPSRRLLAAFNTAIDLSSWRSPTDAPTISTHHSKLHRYMKRTEVLASDLRVSGEAPNCGVRFDCWSA